MYANNALEGYYDNLITQIFLFSKMYYNLTPTPAEK